MGKTAGPWVARLHGPFADITGAMDRSVALCVAPEDARLIAAAPDLLAALKELVAANDAVQLALCDGPDVPGFDRKALPTAQRRVIEAEEVARAAIAKAEA